MATATLIQVEELYGIKLPEFVLSGNKESFFYLTASYDGYGQIYLLQLLEDNSVKHFATYLEDSYTNTGKFELSSQGYNSTDTYKSLFDASATIGGCISAVFEGVELPTHEYASSVKDITQYREENGYYFYNEELEEFIEFSREEVLADMLKREDYNLTEKELDTINDYESIQDTSQGYILRDENDYCVDIDYISAMVKINNTDTTSIDLNSLIEEFGDSVKIEGYDDQPYLVKPLVELVLSIPCFELDDEDEEITQEDVDQYVKEEQLRALSALNLNDGSSIQFDCYYNRCWGTYTLKATLY